jgi:phage shock protein PspC (stress-responsive transcriptional regulator)
MMLFGISKAFSQTFALVVTFVGIGVIVNVLIIYIVAQVIGERRQNRERRQR